MKKAILKFMVNVCLACMSILLVLSELGLRMTSFKNLLPIRQLNSLRNYLRADAITGYDIVESAPSSTAYVDGISYSIWSNELGCFDRPFDREQDASLLVGDSFTFAFAPFESKWRTRTEELLGHRILKCGVGDMAQNRKWQRLPALSQR